MATNTPLMPMVCPCGLAQAADGIFFETLYRSTRDDLWLINAEEEFIYGLIGMQQHAQIAGYGDMFPNAQYYVVEKQSVPIGRVVVDFGHNEVRIIDIAFIPGARGQGYGTAILRGMQQAAAQVRAPLALSVLKSNLVAKTLYMQLGFQVEESLKRLTAWSGIQPRQICGAINPINN